MHQYSTILLLLNPFNDLFSRTTRASWHLKGKPFWILTSYIANGAKLSSRTILELGATSGVFSYFWCKIWGHIHSLIHSFIYLLNTIKRHCTKQTWHDILAISYKGDKISCLSHLVLEIWHGTDRQTTWLKQKVLTLLVCEPNKARDDGWQWHQLDHMQIICTSLQKDNHSSTSPLRFYRPDALQATHPKK